MICQNGALIKAIHHCIPVNDDLKFLYDIMLKLLTGQNESKIYYLVGLYKIFFQLHTLKVKILMFWLLSPKEQS